MRIVAQMAESMPGTMSVFAEAYRRQQGADWDSKTALQELYGTLKPGKNLNTAELSPFLVDVLRERAAPKLDIAMQTSQAWQGRFQNARSDWTRTFSESGGEAGYRNVFRGFTGFMESFPEIPESTARRFESITNAASALMALPGSIRAAVEGEDSLIGDWLGEEVIEKARTNLESIASAVAKIKGLLPERTQNPDGPQNFIGHVAHRSSMIGAGFLNLGGTIGRVVQGEENPFNIPLSAMSALYNTPYIAATGRSLTGDISFGANSLYEKSLDWREDLTEYGLSRQQAVGSLRYGGGNQTTVGDINITIQAGNLSDPVEMRKTAEEFKGVVTRALEGAMPAYPD